MLKVYERAYRLYVVTYKICQMLQSWDKLLSSGTSEIHPDCGITVEGGVRNPDVSYPDDSYPKLRWFVPNAKMIRTQTLDDSYPTAYARVRSNYNNRSLSLRRLVTRERRRYWKRWDFSLTYNSKGNVNYTKLASSHFSLLDGSNLYGDVWTRGIINFTKLYFVSSCAFTRSILLSRALSRELDEINHLSLSLCTLVTRERRRY